MKPALAILPPALLYLSCASMALSQGVPTTQPALLSITREEVKLGHGASHAALEKGWPAAYARAKSTDYYLALVAMTGPNETWYVGGYESHTARAASMKREDGDAVLTAELERLRRADADHISSVRTVEAMARPDLSHGTFPDLAMMRFWEVTTFRVRPGHEQGFAAAAKAYVAAATRAAPGSSWRTYEVLAGLPGPTYFVFGTMENFAEFDRGMQQNEALMRAFTPDELAVLEKFASAGLVNSETQRFRLDPGQSYVDASTRAKDPAFWSPPRRTASQP